MRMGPGAWVLALPEIVMDEELLSDEDRNLEYLRQHPAQELSLWTDWVQAVCRWKKIAPPTGREWDALMATWRHGKTPAESVDELVAMRLQPPHPAPTGRELDPL